MPDASISQQILAFSAARSAPTSLGKWAQSIGRLPDDVGELCAVLQGLMIYDAVAEDYYGFKPPESRLDEIHIRSVEDMLDRINALNNAPLDTPRPPEERLLARCDHYVLLLTAILRAKGLPARARCGFAAFFNPPKYEDHWTCEWWNAEAERWQFADPQFDTVWRRKRSPPRHHGCAA